MKQALLIIDIQNDYFAGGRMELHDMEKAAMQAQQLLTHFRSQKLPILHIQHFAQRENAHFFIPNTSGVEIHALVKPETGETIVSKHYPNSFRETVLHERLQQNQIEQLIICGAMSHLCIDSTVRAAFDLNYSCVVISDACATKNLSYHNEYLPAQYVQASFMAALNNTFAEVVSLNQYLTGVSNHAYFAR